jgi:hypothetical protein
MTDTNKEQEDKPKALLTLTYTVVSGYNGRKKNIDVANKAEAVMYVVEASTGPHTITYRGTTTLSMAQVTAMLYSDDTAEQLRDVVYNVERSAWTNLRS